MKGDLYIMWALMIIIVLLFIYLGYALINPEKF